METGQRGYYAWLKCAHTASLQVFDHCLPKLKATQSNCWNPLKLKLPGYCSNVVTHLGESLRYGKNARDSRKRNGQSAAKYLTLLDCEFIPLWYIM